MSCNRKRGPSRYSEGTQIFKVGWTLRKLRLLYGNFPRRNPETLDEGELDSPAAMRPTTLSLVGTLVGGSFWGLSGTAAQALFQDYNFPVVGLVSLRTLVSGTLLFLACRPAIPNRNELPRLLLLSLLGFAATQLTYLAAIQYSNAPTATLLQFLFLPMVAGYESLTGALRFSGRWAVALISAIAGTLLLIGVVSGTGTFQVLITPIGIIAGLLAAVTGAFHSLASRSFVRERGSWWLVSWGFLIAGFATLPLGAYSLLAYAPNFPSNFQGQLSVTLLVSFMIVFGTILSFGLYLAGLRRLSATEIGVAASMEPITAAIAAFVFLGVKLDLIQYLGGGLILLAVMLIATRSEPKTVVAKETKK